MCDSNSNKECLEIYKITRSRIEFEYSQIGNRLNWLITSQAFIFTALVVSIKSNLNDKPLNMFHAIKQIADHSLLYPILPFLGLIISSFVIIGTWAAILRIASLKINENYLREKLKNGIYNYAVIPRNQLAHYLGLFPPIFIPIAFLTTWYIIIDKNIISFLATGKPVDNIMSTIKIAFFIQNIGLGIFAAILFLDAFINSSEGSMYSVIINMLILIFIIILFYILTSALYLSLEFMWFFIAFCVPFILCIITAMPLINEFNE